MNTKISNAFYFFLMIICVSMVSYLAYRHFFAGKKETYSFRNRRTPVVRAIEKAIPAVVSLRTKRYSLEHDDLTVSGSGTIIDQSGLILTNRHVVSGAGEIFATLNSGAVCSAYVIAEDPQNDIALLKLVNPPVFLPVIPLMRPWKLLLGETVIAVGNPYGLDGTITVGILSGINRSLADGNRLLFTDLLQTDAAVFPGNSGGPLINLDGCMIGMNMAVKRNAPGISFAVPLSRIENVLAGYLLPERMLNLDFGILPQCDEKGRIMIAEVFPGSPAEKAGIRKGMELISFDSLEPAGDLLSLSQKLIRLVPGRSYAIRLKGIGTVMLVPQIFTEEDAVQLAEWKLGLKISSLFPDVAESLDFPFRYGVIVSGFSGEQTSQFRRGDIIAEWNGERIQSIRDLGRILKNMAPGAIGTAVVYSQVSDTVRGRYLERRVIRMKVH